MSVIVHLDNKSSRIGGYLLSGFFISPRHGAALAVPVGAAPPPEVPTEYEEIILYKPRESQFYRVFYKSLSGLKTFEGDMHYAYIRVSSVDQHVDRQKEALSASDIKIDKIYIEQARAKNINRSEPATR
ncbi:hypothetical protein [Photorhabdus luminescens]|uniref:hypothetical protein n=1 Tax=Photorhabdus luminescens TaxID=29488 RepID=UPI001F014FA5|nr:hypothetical protein [Photorhabdus luminescens]